jgi:aldehyde dehydrogenase (NAD+)
VGKIVMRAAAEHLSSVTLELGGKSPVIVDETADLDTAAAKIAWLKAMNAGQICIAPDYVLAHESIHDKLVEKIVEKTQKFYGTDMEKLRQNPDYCRIIHPKHLKRLQNLQEDALRRGAKLAFGGQNDDADRFYSPTLLTHVPDDAIIWQEEIFGPILPVKAYRNTEQAISIVNDGQKPLAMYIFSQNKRNVNHIISETRCGGVTVNDCGAHFYNTNLPFGGVNNSGIGKCHGEFGFLEFSNARGITRQAHFFPTTDLFLPPYKGKWKKWLLEVLVRWM